MKLKIILSSLISLLLFNISCATIRIVCTAALTNVHFEYRKKQYVDAFNMLKHLGYGDFYVVEALKKRGPTFLEEFTPNVFYATVNNPKLKNHGINEAKTFLEGCIHFDFDPEDMVVKLTGRYSLTSDLLLKAAADNQNMDAIVKVNEDGNVFTVGFAMRYKYFKEMYETIDYEELNRTMNPIEYRVGDYIKKKKKAGKFNVLYLERLDIAGNSYGSTTAPLASDAIRTW